MYKKEEKSGDNEERWVRQMGVIAKRVLKIVLVLKKAACVADTRTGQVTIQRTTMTTPCCRHGGSSPPPSTSSSSSSSSSSLELHGTTFRDWHISVELELSLERCANHSPFFFSRFFLSFPFSSYFSSGSPSLCYCESWPGAKGTLLSAAVSSPRSRPSLLLWLSLVLQPPPPLEGQKVFIEDLSFLSRCRHRPRSRICDVTTN